MSENIITGWEPERRTHFDEIVDNYDKIRPKYPNEMFEDIIKYSRLERSGKALEIGAGTGKATAPFLIAGYDVTAVEIGENMVKFLLERFKEYKHFRVINSSFEDAILNDDSYDLIYAASAFHWVDHTVGCPKMFRLLRSGGVCALLRYNFNICPAEGEELFEEFQALYEKYYCCYFKSNNRPIRLTHELLETPRKIKAKYGFEDLQDYGFEDVSMKFYDAVLNYNVDEYIALLDTMTDNRSLPEENRVALYDGIKKIINNHGGYRKLDFIFQLYMGR
jgi:SAM-dependent methyltransferase